MRARPQHVGELAERVLADDFAVVEQLEVADLLVVDVEMVGPELDHALVQLALGERGAIQRRFLQLIHERDLVLLVQPGPVQREVGIRVATNGVARAVVDRAGLELVLEVAREAQSPWRARTPPRSRRR